MYWVMHLMPFIPLFGSFITKLIAFGEVMDNAWCMILIANLVFGFYMEE